MDVDPLASMRRWAITIELGGGEYEIPALSAVDWWPVLAEGNPAAILDFLRSNDPANDADLDMLILNGSITGKELGEVLTAAIEEVTGRSAHVAFTLAMAATIAWPTLGGQMAKSGFNWEIQPIGAALDLIYLLFLSSLEEEPRKKFEALLEKGSDGKPSASKQAAIDAEFAAMAGPRPAPAPLPEQTSGAPSYSSRPRTRTRPRPNPQGAPSGAPTPQPASPVGSGPAATSGRRTGEARPASDTGPLPPHGAR